MSEQQLFKVTIDNITIEVPAGTSILEAARKIGGEVAPPAMCFYSKLKGSGGKCRTCLVEVSKGSEKDPRPMPKLVASCRTTVMDGMEVKNITSPKVIDARAGICMTQLQAQLPSNDSFPANSPFMVFDPSSYMWDGVDRSNGFEKKLVEAEYEKKRAGDNQYKRDTEHL